MAKVIRYRGNENKPMAEAFRGLRSSSAAQPHTLKKNKGTRTAKVQRAVREFA